MTKRVLIVVKTYPHPSRSYQELVCTAGMLEDGSFIRLYPVDFRYRPLHQWYEKYQWIDVDVTQSDKDPRPESYRPVLESIQLVGKPLSTTDFWAERKSVVLAKPPQTVCTLQQAYQKDRTSLGIVRPQRITELRVRPTSPTWKPTHQNALAQINLFDQQKKPLQKIPFKFSYRMFCDDQCRGHTTRMTDWELGALFLKELNRFGNENKAARSVHSRFFEDICGVEKDTYFFVGTTWPYNSWIVLGAFYPKKPSELPTPKKQISPSKPEQFSLNF